MDAVGRPDIQFLAHGLMTDKDFPSEVDLIRAAAAGDHVAYKVIMEHYAPLVNAQLYGSVKSTDVEDLLEGFKNVGPIGDYDDRMQFIWLGPRRSTEKHDLEGDSGASLGQSGTDFGLRIQLALGMSE